jgi:hypothetical protein
MPHLASKMQIRCNVDMCHAGRALHSAQTRRRRRPSLTTSGSSTTSAARLVLLHNGAMLVHQLSSRRPCCITRSVGGSDFHPYTKPLGEIMIVLTMSSTINSLHQPNTE